MGSTNGKMRVKDNTYTQDPRLYNDQLVIATFGYVGQFQRRYGSEWPLNILKSPIIYLIIAYFPRRFEIYGIGHNKFGEFGVGHNEAILRYKRLSRMCELLDHPSNIFRGYGRFMIKTINGELYCCGNNYRGDIGSNYLNETYVNKFQQIAQTEKYNQEFYCNIIGDGVISNHTIVVSNYPHNNLYAFGSNRRGQFGNFYEDQFRESNFMPIQILYQQILKHNIFHNETISKIQCGEYHTLFLTQKGNVFAAGDNIYGQCGVYYDFEIPENSGRRQKKAYLPVIHIRDLHDIIDIACGSYHNLSIDHNHDVFVWGDNPNGQLAVPLYKERGKDHFKDSNDDVNDNQDNIIYKPLKCEYFASRNIKISNIETGNCHSSVLDSNGNCWTFGDNQYGQCGTGGHDFNAISKPHLFNSLDKLKGILIEQISCGYDHTVVLSYLNEIYTFGGNEYSQCSSALKHKKIIHPWLLTRGEIGIDENCRIETVIAGLDTTLIILKN